MQINICSKANFLFACCLIFFTINTFAAEYLIPGSDSYEDMVHKLGRPIRVEHTVDGRNFYYRDIIVNISGNDQTTIFSVSYLKPRIYQRYLNLDVGMSSEEIKSQLFDYYEHKEKT
jgi:hypothetical protein